MKYLSGVANCTAMLGVISLLLVVQDLVAATKDKPDRSGWKKLTIGPPKRQEDPDLNLPLAKLRTFSLADSQQTSGSRNFVEWDDDEPQDANKSRPKNATERRGLELNQQTSLMAKGETANDLGSSWHKWRDTNSKYNRLVFHGQLRGNDTVKLVDGLKIQINIRDPVSIIRAEPKQKQQLSEAPHFQALDEEEKPNKVSSTSRSAELRVGKPEKSRQLSWLDDSKSIHLTSSSSDWKPIVVSKTVSRPRSSVTIVDVNQKPTRKLLDLSGVAKSKWKPVSSERASRARGFQPKSKLPEPISPTPSNLAEPFDDVGLVTVSPALRDSNSDARSNPGKKRESKSIGVQKNSTNAWTPLELTTVYPSDTASLTGTTLSSNLNQTQPTIALNNSDLAQRSASDVNYIYSQAAPQPQPQQIDWQLPRQPVAAPTSYYSSYINQPQQQVEQPATSIIDNTSGQTPEMIPDRVELPPVPPMVDYSSSPVNVNYQQPARQPLYTSGYGQPQAQPVRQAPAPQPVVRQEHHYHYYNQPARQQVQSDRQSSERSQQQSSQPASIIREIQPLFIQQPVIQQQPSTTAAPQPQQIIREIIKEVPVAQTIQQIQMPRLLPVPPIPIPLSPASRELEPVFSNFDNPTQRIIRHISNSVPTVSVQVPSGIPLVAPIRVPLPNLQLPVRLAAQGNLVPVTRQTGSFMIPAMPKKTTTYLTETQAVPSHTTIMHTTQFTPATRTTVYTTDHQDTRSVGASSGYRSRR